MKKTNFHYIAKLLKKLEEKGCIRIGDSNKDGTLLTFLTPKEIPLVREKLASPQKPTRDDDYFNDPAKRRDIFERDQWICQYCGEKLTLDNATIDHYIPQSKSGGHDKTNLRTCCLICNSIKSGKTYEEAAPSLLKSIQERKSRVNRI